MMETSQETQENEYDDLYIAEFSRNTSLLDDTMMIMIQIVIILKKLKKLSELSYYSNR